MSISRKLLWVFLPALFLSACMGIAPVKNDISANTRPAWIDNPGNGVSASAGMNVYGRVRQEEAAIARARVEYAKRFGVSIEAGQILSTTVANDRASTVGVSVSHEETRQSDVKAIVKAKWRDEDADVLWVWLVPSN
jgi:hypothetical protein